MARSIVLFLCVSLLAPGCKPSCRKDRPPGPSPTTEQGASARDRSVEDFIEKRWLEPQMKGNIDGYASLLAQEFEGTVLKSTGEKMTLGRSEWIQRRAKALESRPTITVENLHSRDPGSGKVVVTFSQSWETGKYCDVGTKVVTLETSGESFLVTKEEMSSVEECPWAAPSTFFTFARNYRKAWRQEDLDYIAAHTCMPFAFNSLIARGGTRSTEEQRYERLGDLIDGSGIRDLLRTVAITDRPTTHRLGPGGCVFEVTAETSGEVAIVDVATTSCDVQESYRLEFSFEDTLWKLCSLRHEVVHPS